MSEAIPKITQSEEVQTPAELRREMLRTDSISIRSVMLTGIFVLLLFYTLYFAAPVLMPITLALLFSLLLTPLVRLLAKLAVPEPIGAFIVLALVLGSLGGALSLLATPAQEWISKAPTSIYRIEDKLKALREPIAKIQRATAELEQATQLSKEKTPKIQIDRPSLTSILLSGTPQVLAGIGVVIILVYFLLASGDSLTRKVVRVVPKLTGKKRAVEIIRGIESDISYYLLTVTLINLGLGACVALALAVLGLPNPLLWGAMVAVFNFAPYIGAVASTIILVAVSLLTFDTLAQAALVPGVVVGLSILEGQFITPMILGRRLSLSPVAIFISMIFWGWLWGIPGALLAVPLLASFKLICENLEPLRPIAAFLSSKEYEPP